MSSANEPMMDPHMQLRSYLYLAVVSFSVSSQQLLTALATVQGDPVLDQEALAGIEQDIRDISRRTANCFMMPALADMAGVSTSVPPEDITAVLPLLQAAVENLRAKVKPN